MTDFDVITTSTGVRVIRGAGRLNLASAPRLTAAVTALLAGGHRRIVVDLAATQFLDSSGLGALVTCLKAARRAGGDLRLANPTEQVATVLALTNLSQLLRASATLDDAVGAF